MAPGDGSALPPNERHDAGTYQMLWDCRFCGTQKLLGLTHRHCPNCGAAQDPVWRYFPAEEDMVTVEDHPYVGADKICPACQQPNSAASSFCSECGADLSTGQTVQTQGERDIGTGAAETDTRRDVVKDQFEAEMGRIQATEEARSGCLGLPKGMGCVIAGIALMVLVFVGIMYAATYRTSADADVSGLAWERTIIIQEFGPVADSGWRNTLPADAYNLSCTEREHGSRQVVVGSHEECRDVDQGDGTFQRVCRTVPDYDSEPIYDEWCSYQVDRWAFTRQVVARGEGKTPAPAWPQVTLAPGIGRFGQERAAGQDERYAVTIRLPDGDTHTCTFERQADWDRYTIGAKVTLELTITGAADCSTLALAQ